MRFDLSGGGRPAWKRVLVRWAWAVMRLPPLAVQFMGYAPRLMSPTLERYLLRANAGGKGSWSKGEVELFGAFTSRLNQCHY